MWYLKGYGSTYLTVSVNTVRKQNKVTVNYDHQPPPMNEQRLVSNANELLQVKIEMLKTIRTMEITTKSESKYSVNELLKELFRCSQIYPEQQ